MATLRLCALGLIWGGGLAQVVTENGVVLGDSNFSIPWVKFPDAWVAASRDANTSIDWRKRNAVTPTKKQCGGTCGTYSFLENAESQYAIKTGNLSVMSDAQVLHCHNGSIFDQLISLGAESAAEYPRDCNLSSPCLFDPSKVLYRGWTATTECPGGPAGGEDQVAAWVLRNGPVSTAVQSEIFLQRDLSNFVTADRCHVLPGGTDHAVNIGAFRRAPAFSGTRLPYPHPAPTPPCSGVWRRRPEGAVLDHPQLVGAGLGRRGVRARVPWLAPRRQPLRSRLRQVLRPRRHRHVRA